MNPDHICFASRPLVKVCGITRQKDLDLCMEQGVDFCGFIFHPDSKRYISPSDAAGLQSSHIKRVGVFVEQEAEEILRIMEEARLDYAQLHGNQSSECARKIGPEHVIRVLWPQRYGGMDDLLADMKNHAPDCKWFLLDSGTSGGGSGEQLPWEEFARMRTPRPWILAGGISPETLRRALISCCPNAIDLNSGVEESPGIKSRRKLLETLQATAYKPKNSLESHS